MLLYMVVSTQFSFFFFLSRRNHNEWVIRIDGIDKTKSEKWIFAGLHREIQMNKEHQHSSQSVHSKETTKNNNNNQIKSHLYRAHIYIKM